MPRVIHEDHSRGFIHMCHMTHSYGCHDSFIWVPWLIHMGAMTHSYRCHDSFICVPWLIHIGAMTHSSAWTFMYDTRSLVWFRFSILQHGHADLCYIYVSCRKSRSLVWFPVETVIWHFPLKMLQPRNPPNRATHIPRYLAIQIQIEISVEFEFVPRNLGIAIWWISGV